MDLFRRIGTQKKKFKVQFFIGRLKFSSFKQGFIYIVLKRGDHKIKSEQKLQMTQDNKLNFNKQILEFQATLYYDEKEQLYQQKTGELSVILLDEKQNKVLLGSTSFDIAAFANSGQQTSKENKILQNTPKKFEARIQYSVFIKYLGEGSVSSVEKASEFFFGKNKEEPLLEKAKSKSKPQENKKKNDKEKSIDKKMPKISSPNPLEESQDNKKINQSKQQKNTKQDYKKQKQVNKKQKDDKREKDDKMEKNDKREKKLLKNQTSAINYVTTNKNAQEAYLTSDNDEQHSKKIFYFDEPYSQDQTEKKRILKHSKQSASIEKQSQNAIKLEKNKLLKQTKQIQYSENYSKNGEGSRQDDIETSEVQRFETNNLFSKSQADSSRKNNSISLSQVLPLKQKSTKITQKNNLNQESFANVKSKFHEKGHPSNIKTKEISQERTLKPNDMAKIQNEKLAQILKRQTSKKSLDKSQLNHKYNKGNKQQQRLAQNFDLKQNNKSNKKTLRNQTEPSRPSNQNKKQDSRKQPFNKKQQLLKIDQPKSQTQENQDQIAISNKTKNQRQNQSFFSENQQDYFHCSNSHFESEHYQNNFKKSIIDQLIPKKQNNSSNQNKNSIENKGTIYQTRISNQNKEFEDDKRANENKGNHNQTKKSKDHNQTILKENNTQLSNAQFFNKSTANQNLQELRKQNSYLQSKIENSESTIKQLKNQLYRSKQSISELTDQIQYYQLELKQKQQQLKSEKVSPTVSFQDTKQLQKLKHQLKRIQKEKNQLIVQNSQLRQKSKKDFAKYQQILEEKSQKQQLSLSKLKADIQKFKQQNSNLREKLEKLIIDNNLKSNDILKQKTITDNLQTQLTQVKQSLSQIKFKICQMLNEALSTGESASIQLLTELNKH